LHDVRHVCKQSDMISGMKIFCGSPSLHNGLDSLRQVWKTRCVANCSVVECVEGAGNAALEDIYRGQPSTRVPGRSD
jgi:hypothetical protein